MDVKFSATELRGSIAPPPFKSEVIRCLILSGMAGVRPHSVVRPSDRAVGDIRSACAAVDAAFFRQEGPNCGPIPAGESATVLRLLAPVLLAMRGKALFTVGPSLFERDMNGISGCIGCEIFRREPDLIGFRGSILTGRIYTIDASGTSQFASGLLLASLLVPGMGVKLKEPVSMPYIDLTLDCMARFGCPVHLGDNGVYRPPSARIKPPEALSFSPDSSYCANFIAANYLMGKDAASGISIPHFEKPCLHPDLRIRSLLYEEDYSIADSPDLFPILCAAALKKKTVTVIRGVSRLRGKESDRPRAVEAMIKAIGGEMLVTGDAALIRGCGGRLAGGVVDSFGDHRIVMAAAVASLMCENGVTVREADRVRKSAPGFIADFIKLGGTADELVWQQD